MLYPCGTPTMGWLTKIVVLCRHGWKWQLGPPSWYENAKDWDDEKFTELEQELATKVAVEHVASQSGSGCGTNDGDQGYVEDNDRDNSS